MLDEIKIRAQLKELAITAPKIITYSLTDSTNTRAREFAKSHPDNKAPTVFIADGQTNGRGRRGRSFFSEQGAGIYISFLIYPESRGADATRVTAHAAVALAEAISAVTSLQPKIKWVNDIYSGEKKLVGILAESEMSADGNIAFLVVGMGVNVYKTTLPDEISDIATSIEAECGERVSRELLTAEIIKNILFRTLSEEELLARYRDYSFIVGKEITVTRISGESYTAKATEILDDYSLLVDKPDGSSERLFTGEVSTKIKQKQE